MKYIDAALLKKEIEYLKAVHIGHAAITKETNAVDGLDAALQVIDSLQQEQPEVDLEKEIERVVENYNSLANGSKVMKPSGVEKIARHFYELGLNTRKEEQK